MVRTIEMQDMRYINLFERITGVRPRFCIRYNEAVIFCVGKKQVSRAVGINGKNVKKLNEILGKKIKIVFCPESIEDAESFIESIISPVTFRDLEIRDDEIVVNAGTRNKAALIGRNKKRLQEMQKITRDFFNREFKIV